MEQLWSKVDAFFDELFLEKGDISKDIIALCNSKGLPQISVSPQMGKFLFLLVKIKQPKLILEIGTLGAYSTIWMARALEDGPKIITLEANENCAAIASRNIENSGFQNKIDLRRGRALETLPQLEKENFKFDMIFIDADKRNNPHYLDWCLKLSKAGTIIVTDNTVRNGEILNTDNQDEDIAGIRKYLKLLSENDRIDSASIQTVGIKDYDGFTLSIVKD